MYELFKVFVDKEVRTYFIEYIAGCISGFNKIYTLKIGTGNISNSKSITSLLIKKTFGDYCVSIPNSTITNEQFLSDIQKVINMLDGTRLTLINESTNLNKKISVC